MCEALVIAGLFSEGCFTGLSAGSVSFLEHLVGSLFQSSSRASTVVGWGLLAQYLNYP